jgi:hypothetical protein
MDKRTKLLITRTGRRLDNDERFLIDSSDGPRLCPAEKAQSVGLHMADSDRRGSLSRGPSESDDDPKRRDISLG